MHPFALASDLSAHLAARCGRLHPLAPRPGPATTLPVAGGMTGLGCEGTARARMTRSFRAVILSDAFTARSDAEPAGAPCGVHAHLGDVPMVAASEAGLPPCAKTAPGAGR